MDKKVKCINNTNVENFLNKGQCYFVLKESLHPDYPAYCLENLPEMWFRKDKFLDEGINEESISYKALKQMWENNAQVNMLNEENILFEKKINDLKNVKIKQWGGILEIFTFKKEYKNGMKIADLYNKILKNDDQKVLLLKNNLFLLEIIFPSKK